MDEYIISDEDIDKIIILLKNKIDKNAYTGASSMSLSDSVEATLKNYIETKCDKYSNY